jgi:superfamily II DNA or RNA helicase
MKVLRDYQTDSVQFFTSDAGKQDFWRVLTLPTGGGKTVVLKCAAKITFDQGLFDKIVFIAPFRNISKSFARDESFLVNDETGKQIQVDWVDAVHIIPSERGISVPENSASDWLWSEFQKPDPSVLVCSHQLFVRVFEDKSKMPPQSLSRCLLVIDETHHSGEQEVEVEEEAKGTKLGKIANRWADAGGSIWAVTATPIRSDAQRIFPPGAKTLEYSYIELAEKGYLPKNVMFRTIQVPGTTQKDQLDDVAIQKICTAIASVRTEEGLIRPTVIRIPQGSSAQPTQVLAGKFHQALIRSGIAIHRILNAVGNDAGVSQEFEEALEIERQAAEQGSWALSDLDVIISCRRMSEGADWPFCSHVALVGLPQSILSVAQTVGRGSRNKHGFSDYPSDWKEEILVSCFVPEDITSNDEEVRRALLMCSAIECNESIIDFRRFWDNVIRGFSLPPKTQKAVEKSFTRTDFSVWGAARVLTAAAEQAVSSSGLPVTLENLDAYAREWQGASDVRDVARQIWLHQIVKANGDRSQVTLGPTPAYHPNKPEGDTYDFAADVLESLVQQFQKSVVPTQIVGLKGTQGNLDLEMRKKAIQAFIQERDQKFPLTAEDIANFFHKKPQFYRDLSLHGLGSDLPLTSEFKDATGKFRRICAGDLDRFLQRRYSLDLRRFMLVIRRDDTKRFPCPVTGPSLRGIKFNDKITKSKKDRLRVAWADIESGKFGSVRVHAKDPKLSIQIDGRLENLFLLKLSSEYGWREIDEEI